MTKGAFRIPVYGGGSPDPATYCPTEGFYDPDDPDSPVIWNPIDPGEWTLLAEFQTNSPNPTTFDPSIAATSGEYSWDLGDGTKLIGQKSVSHTYLTTATRTVKLWGKGTCAITSLDMGSDHIVGELDLSHDAFKTLTQIVIANSTELTGIILPSVSTGTISNINITNTGIIGTLDLSIFTAFSSSATIYLRNNPDIIGVTFASSITGKIGTLQLDTTGIAGIIDLSMFTTWTTSAMLHLYANPLMTGVTFASSITGAFSQLWIHSTGITGTFDLSKFTTFSTSTSIRLNLNPSMTGVTFASSITGTINELNISSTGITGTFDLSKFTAFSTSAIVHLYSNPSMTGVTFASSITGTISQLFIYSTGIVGTLDLSKFTAYTTTATVYLYSNASLTGVTFPASTITGFVRTLRINGNTSLGYVDLTKLRTGVDSLIWQMHTNGWTAAIVNQILVNIDSISASGFTGRVINIGDTNADPDTTSGGYNGTAARTSLQGKGFTVTIT